MVEKSRPVLVLAYPQPNDARALVVVAPLTSQIRGLRGEEGARPSGRRNARQQRPRQTLRTRPPTHPWVSPHKNGGEIRSP